GTDGLLEHLDVVLSETNEHDFTHIGIGRAAGDSNPYHWTWAILLVERKFEMDPLPRAAPLGETLPLRFALAEALAEPEVLVMSGNGKIETLPVTQAGPVLQAQLPTGDVPGQLWIEILAQGPLGPEVIALFPLYVGTTVPTAFVGPMPPDESWIASMADAERL